MAKFVLAGVRFFSGGADLTGVSNKLEMTTDVEDKDVTCWPTDDSGVIWKEVLGGLKSSSIAGEGKWEAGDLGMVDDVSWTDLGGVGAVTICPDKAVVGNTAYVMKALRGSYQLGGSVGDAAPWTANLSGSGPIARGVVGHGPATPRTATGNGTAFQLLGGVPAGKSLRVNLHVLSVAGTATPTLTAEVKSSVDNTFGAPTQRVLFAPATVRGSQSLTTAGPITDTWFKVNWTISGTTPSFVFVCSVGIA